LRVSFYLINEGERIMHDLKDIKRIVENYYVEAGHILETGGYNHDFTAAKVAEEHFSEGLRQLKSLKLSPGNRRNIRLIRNAFELGIKFSKALQRRQLQKAELLAEQSADYAQQYNAAVLARAVIG